MATPQHRIDETKGLTLVTRDGASREQTRYLFTALDVLDPDRKTQLPRLRSGGEEVDARCLRRTPNYIPRCELTPLETWFEPLGINELAGDRMQDLVSVGQTAQPALPPMMHPGQFFRAQEPMMGMPHYPGVDLPLIIEVSGYRGVKEIEGMRGIDWEGGEAQRIQDQLFPSLWTVPVPLRLIEERIAEERNNYPQIAEELLESCARSRRWAMSRIDLEHGLLATRKEHQHTYRYSRLAPQLLAQLEMNPKDQGTEVTQLAQAMVRELLAAQQSISAPKEAVVDINAIVEAAVKAALLAQGVGAPEVTEAVAGQFVCDACGKSFDSAQGVAMHKTRWCENKETESTE